MHEVKTSVSREEAQQALLQAFSFFENDATPVTERGLSALELVRNHLFGECDTGISLAVIQAHNKLYGPSKDDDGIGYLNSVIQFAVLIVDRFAADTTPIPLNELRLLARRTGCISRGTTIQTELDILRMAGLLVNQGAKQYAPGPKLLLKAETDRCETT